MTRRRKRRRSLYVTDKELRQLFISYNRKFFDGKIREKDTIVEFGSPRDCEGAYAITLAETDEIYINEIVRCLPVCVSISLLHEMAHLILYQNGYEGYTKHGGHQIRFYAEIDRLYKAGAYEGLL